MLITLAIALFIVVIVASRTTRNRKTNESFWKHYAKYIIIGSAVILTIVLMNVFRPRVYLYNLEEIIEVAGKTDNEYVAWEKREIRSKLDPYSVPKLLEYVEDCEKFENYDKNSLIKEEYSDIPEMQRLALAHVEALIPFSKFDSIYKIGEDGVYQENYPDTTLPYHNYIIGKRKLTDYEFKEAIVALNREKQLNPDYKKTYPALYAAYRISNTEDFREFITERKNAQYLDQRELVGDYFNLGEYYLYFKTIYVNRFIDFNFIALVSGLMISLVWMIFLRNMDFFRKERWIDMTIVFLLGALFTNLCHFLYDTAHYDLGIQLNGEAANDLFYCIGVIGFFEELVKFLPWILCASLTKRLKEPIDYIIYASVAALGFAFTENLVYLENPSNIVVRFIMSTTMHMFDATLIAYSMILAKYRFKSARAKMLAPVVGFWLACIAHGFYDFWLISASAEGLSIITTIFFFVAIHFWFYMINNATNQSPYFDGKLLRIKENNEFLSLSILGIIVLQYVIFCIEYGALSANLMLRFGTVFTIGFLLYITFVLSNFRAIQGQWARYSFPAMKLLREYIDIPFASRKAENHTGQHLRIFCSKTNQYIGSQLPVSGHCERKVTVNNDENWYLFRLNQGVEMNGFHSNLVILKPKSKEDDLKDEKIEIYLMFIPLGLDLYAENISMKRLRYTGKAYSRPI
ncbi:MAG: PrsW family intramembrane metalloprotease [Crocinitomicaceae bacterium]|nr:PrsW family intramembrane metalloprotease [Crocinitomicaceae bacterium]